MERTNPYLNNIAYYLLMLFAFVLMLSNALAEIIAVCILVIWIAQSLAYRRKEWLDYPLFIPVAALVLYKILILLISGYGGKFAQAFEQLSLPLIYFIVPTVVATAERRRKIIWILISGALIAAGIGIIKYLSGNDVYAVSTASGVYTLSNYLVMILGILMAIFVFSKTIKDRVFIGLVSLPILVGLLFTFTRASYLVGLIFILVLGIFKDRKLLIPVFAIAAFVFFFSPSTIERIENRFDFSNKKQFYSYRDDVLEFALPRINDVNFFGYGINSFEELARESNNQRINDGKVTTWHSLYLEYLFDCGPFALIFLFWIIYSQFRYSLARYRKTKDPEQKAFQLSSLLIVIGVIILGFFADIFRDPIISMFVWMMLGLSLV